MGRNRGAYDLVFESDDRIQGYQLASPAVSFNHDPGRIDDVVRNADVPRVIENLAGGMGFSRRIGGVPANAYSHCLPGYTRTPGTMFMPAGRVTEIALPSSGWTPAPIYASEVFQGRLYFLTRGNTVLVLDPGGTSCSVSGTFGASFQGIGMAAFGTRLYASGGLGGLAYLDSGSTTWSAASTSVQRSHLAVASWRPLGVPTDTLIAALPNLQQVRWCPITADPMTDGNWSAPLAVGIDRTRTINKLVAAPRHVYFLRSDGVWDMDELGARAFNLAPWIAEDVDAHNGIWGMHIGPGLYYAHSEGLAYVATSGETQVRPEWAQPGWGLPYEGPVRGQPWAGTLFSGWGMVGFVDGTQTYVCAGRADPGAYGAASHVWHGAEAVLPGYVTHMRTHTIETGSMYVDYPSLYIGIYDPGAARPVRLFKQSLPKVGNPLQELLWGGQFEPADAASLFLPADPWDRPSAVKTLLQLDMLTDRLNVGSDLLRAYARADGEAAWADYGTAEEGAYTSLAPLETTEGRYVGVRVDAVGHPVLRSLELRSALGVELRESRRYSVILAWDNALKGARGRETADPERRLADLRGLLGRVCTMDDGAPDGPNRVRVLQVLPGRRVPLGGPSRAGSHNGEGAWAATAEVLLTILDRPFRYDGVPDVDRYDSDRQWV